MKTTVRIVKYSGISGHHERRSEGRCAVLVQKALIVMDEVVPAFYREIGSGIVKPNQVALFEVNRGDSRSFCKINHLRAIGLAAVLREYRQAKKNSDSDRSHKSIQLCLSHVPILPKADLLA